MTGSAERASRATKEINGEEAERLLLHLYTGLPLLPAAENVGLSAVLARFGRYEVRLTEFPPDRMPFLPLWVELFRGSERELVDSCGFSEIDDTVEAVRELVETVRLAGWSQFFGGLADRWSRLKLSDRHPPARMIGKPPKAYSNAP